MMVVVFMLGYVAGIVSSMDAIALMITGLSIWGVWMLSIEFLLPELYKKPTEGEEDGSR